MHLNHTKGADERIAGSFHAAAGYAISARRIGEHHAGQSGWWAIIKANREKGDREMGPFGVQEMMVIFILALLLFGPKKLPELARLLGKGLTEFRRAKNELKSTLDTHMRELEREVQLEDAKKSPPAAVTAYNPYAYMADEYGKVPTDYGYNGSSESRGESPAVIPAEAPSVPLAAPVEGTIARSTSNGAAEAAPSAPATTGQVHDEHPA